ncbi:MAG: response regulator [Elusimicrobia bacterium]|nr:response regulator [Elusimicrobiota bacterium]
MSLLNIFKSKEPLVMMVDDDLMLMEMYEAFLEALNCKALKVFDSREALSSAKKYKPQLILLDIMMPGITGLQILQSLKIEPSTREIPVMMITGEQRVDDLETAFKFGAVDYMIKPADQVQFDQKIKKLLAPAGYSFPGVN